MSVNSEISVNCVDLNELSEQLLAFACQEHPQQIQETESSKQTFLNDILLTHWFSVLPSIFEKNKNSTTVIITNNESVYYEQLIKPLEHYITCSKVPSEVFTLLREKDDSLSLAHKCEKVFKIGEPVFSCQSCAPNGTASTCSVLCVDCFQNRYTTNEINHKFIYL